MNAKKIALLIGVSLFICSPALCAKKAKKSKAAKSEKAEKTETVKVENTNAKETSETKSTKENSPLDLMRRGKIDELKNSFSYQFDIDEADEDGNTILHMAALKDDGELCTFFMLKGADPDLKNKDSDTALHVAIKGNCLNAAKAIVAMNPETLFSRDAKGRTALDLGLQKDNSYYDVFVTTRVGEIRDTEGQTIVHYFVKTQNYKGINECVKKGIPINVCDNAGITPLEIALQSLNDDISVRVASELILGGAEDFSTDYTYFVQTVSSRNFTLRLQDGQTPLHLASIMGHNAIAKYLLENGADVKAQDSSGATPLHEALRYGNLEIARMLITAGANLNAADNIGKTPAMLVFSKEKAMETYGLLAENHADFTRKDMFGDTVLHTVCMCGSEPEVITFLIEHGAEVNAKNKEGSTPLCIAVQKKNVDVVRVLAEAGADIHAKDAQGISPVIGALINSQEMLKALITQKNVVTVDSEGNTPLHIALLYDAPLSRVKYILSQTEDVNLRNRDGNSPLFICVLKNRKEVGEALLQKGADIFCANNNNNSPLRLALKYSVQVPTVQDWLLNSDTIYSTDGSGNTVLHYAAEWQYGPAITYLLGRNADINAKNAKGETVLFSAAKSNNPEIIQKVVDGGADLYARDNMGSTAIHIAVRWDANIAVEKLLSLGVDVNAQNSSGKSALSEAVLSSKIEVARVLLKNGANPNCCDINGVTVLMDAIRGCNEAVVRLLLENGASPNAQDINGRNAYHEAAFMGDVDIIEIIRNAGGNPLARDKQGKTPFSIVMNNSDDVIMAILGNNKNITDSDGNTPLHIVVKQNGKLELLQTLLNAGYPVDARNSSGYTALNIAVEQNDVDRAVLLLGHGANPFQMIDQKGRNGVTIALEKNNQKMIENIVKYAGNKSDVQGNNILHYAAKSSPAEIVQYLVNCGLVDKNKKNVSGDTPAVMAERWKRSADIINLLK